MKLKLAAAVVMLALLSTGCADRFDPSPKKEVSVFSRQSVKTGVPCELEIGGDYGSIEIYAGSGDQVLYEATDKIKGTGEKEKLQKRLKDFSLKASSEGNKVKLDFRYNGPSGNPVDTRTELTVYIPRRTGKIDMSLKAGKIKIVDDISANVTLSLGSVNTEINRIKGRVDMTAEMGDLKIGGGKLFKGSKADTGAGSLRIKSEFEQGEYSFVTKLGNIELVLPDKTDLDLETAGNIRTNDFQQQDGKVKVRTECAIGEIVVNKY